MVKNLQCLKTLQMCYLGHAEHHAKNRTSLRGLDHDTIFFWMTRYLSGRDQYDEYIRQGRYQLPTNICN